MPSTITDELWAELGPRVERAKHSAAGSPAVVPDRTSLEALAYLADSGCKWRQLPDRFGAWDAVYNRFRRWLAAGVFDRLFVDSTTVRAHPHAAGAPKKPAARTPRRSAAATAGSRPRSTSPARTSRRPSPSS